MANSRRFFTQKRAAGRSFLLFCVLAFVFVLLSFAPAVDSAPPTNATATTSIPGPTSTDFSLPPPAPTSASVPAPGTGNQTAALPPPVAAAGCPPPLVPNLLNLVSSTCMGPCCLPCPASTVFYEPNKLENIYTVTCIVRALSATACGILTISYLLLPSRRKHPHLIVLSFATLMVPWEGLGTIWMYKKKDLLCKNVYEIATMSNSWLCGLQGIALMYIVLVMLCLGFLLIANLHLLTVYRSSLIQSHMSALIIFSFFLPLSLVLPVSIRKQIENPGFGSICFVSSEVASPYFFYPLSVTVCIAILLHLGTIAFMIRANIRANSSSVGDSTSTSFNPNSDTQSNKTLSSRQRRRQATRDISLLLKQQWRPGLFALFLLIIDMVYWLFYFLEAKKLTTIDPAKGWFPEWIQCLTDQAMVSIQDGRLPLTRLPTLAELTAAGDVAQAACASKARSSVPSFVWAATADLLPAMFGMILLMIFGSKVELWSDLRVRLFGTEDSTIFIMGDITKESRDRNQAFQKQQQDRQDQSNLLQAQQIAFYSEELAVIDDFGRDKLISQPQQYHKSIAEDLSREPIYYRNPDLTPTVPPRTESTQYFQQSQAQRRLVDGSEPWPSSPSAASHDHLNGSTVAVYPFSGRPINAVNITNNNSDNGNSSDISPDRGFYRLEEMDSNFSTRPRQHLQYQDAVVSEASRIRIITTRSTLSTSDGAQSPPVPRKSALRKI